jgi:hypothetical protein
MVTSATALNIVINVLLISALFPCSYYCSPKFVCRTSPAVERLQEWFLRLSRFFRIAVASNSFDRTAKQRFFAGSFFLIVFGLFEDEGIVVRVGPAKVFRRRVTTDIAVYTRGIDVVRTADVFFNAVVSIRQYLTPNAYPQSAPISQIRNSSAFSSASFPGQSV